jgi:hypothetical protein
MWKARLSSSEGNSLLRDDQITTVAPVASGVLVSCVMLVMCEEMKEVKAGLNIRTQCIGVAHTWKYIRIPERNSERPRILILRQIPVSGSVDTVSTFPIF